jgi:hypothetical protein
MTISRDYATFRQEWAPETLSRLVADRRAELAQLFALLLSGSFPRAAATAVPAPGRHPVGTGVGPKLWRSSAEEFTLAAQLKQVQYFGAPMYQLFTALFDGLTQSLVQAAALSCGRNWQSGEPSLRVQRGADEDVQLQAR